MSKHLEGAQTVSISFYGSGSAELYVFEARHRGRVELAKVTTKDNIAALLNNGFHGSALRFEGVDAETQKFFKRCAGLR